MRSTYFNSINVINEANGFQKKNSIFEESNSNAKMFKSKYSVILILFLSRECTNDNVYKGGPF